MFRAAGGYSIHEIVQVVNKCPTKQEIYDKRQELMRQMNISLTQAEADGCKELQLPDLLQMLLFKWLNKLRQPPCLEDLCEILRDSDLCHVAASLQNLRTATVAATPASKVPETMQLTTPDRGTENALPAQKSSQNVWFHGHQFLWIAALFIVSFTLRVTLLKMKYATVRSVLDLDATTELNVS